MDLISTEFPCVCLIWQLLDRSGLKKSWTC